ncbi:MAG: hypothetical protein ACREE6_01680 [Limisphaerales bacterium]
MRKSLVINNRISRFKEKSKPGRAALPPVLADRQVGSAEPKEIDFNRTIDAWNYNTVTVIFKSQRRAIMLKLYDS